MNASQPKFVDPSGLVIDVMLDHPDHGVIPYTAIPGDGIYEKAVSGAYGVVTPYAGPSAAQLLIEQENAVIKANLFALDIASVRALREWVAAQPSAPQILKDKETAAVAERAKLK